MYFETRYFARYISTGNITFAAKLLTQAMSCINLYESVQSLSGILTKLIPRSQLLTLEVRICNTSGSSVSNVLERT